MSTENYKTILFITGAFVSNICWDEWREFFEKRGYHTLAPPWPYKDAPVDVLRKRHPDAQVASLRLEQLIQHYEDIAKNLPYKPIIIGHSIGGLIAQILTQRKLAQSAVAIHSVPPQGVLTFKFSFLKAGWGPLGFFTSAKKTFLMSFSQWQYAFTNGMPVAWQEKAYCQFAIPESKNIVRDTITSVAKVDFTKPHSPLLLIAGEADHTIPHSLNHSNYKRYTDRGSVTDYAEFSGRNHFVLGQPGWQEIALYIHNWLEALPH
ncbi:alpha/beta hydrolase [Flavobacterium zepuense]|uniref:Alpha/beta hydrolase n=1 Tax=Flavobacterium zepuense TaxID=2593302 RepID=A0A552V9Y7_9FLAO|nr:alpha/beta hydrolase [Flavobacterium zepuense]TRW27282.1 alpha/beta hydrolase [Flavobacterium zepuense]